MESVSSTAKAYASATTGTGTTTATGTSSPDFPSVSVELLNGLEKPDWGFSTAGWVVIRLLFGFGAAMLRKTHLRRPVI